MKKRLCVLQVAPAEPNKDHVYYFKNKNQCDFYFVTHDVENTDALKFCPNTKWSDTRNILADLVPKDYDYYAFIDYDYILRPQRKLEVLEQILEDLELNPAVLTYYPGKNLETPYAYDQEYFKSKDYSCIPFTHMGLKIIHKSLMSWFYPLCTNFSVDIDSCHMFNIQEIPFLKNVICSHKMIYDNGYSDKNAAYNKDGAYTKYKMDEMWKWIRPAFKLKRVLDLYTTNEQEYDDSLLIKKAFVDMIRKTDVLINKESNDVNYLEKNKDKISQIFDLNHEFFLNKKYELKKQFMKLEGDFEQRVEEYLKNNVTFDLLRQKNNPWIDIVYKLNEELPEYRDITINECIEIYQKMKNNKSLFIYSSNNDEQLKKYLEGKRVAFVGPAPYLKNLNRGSLIDSYDVVVRVQPEIWDPKDYGSRTDIIQSCMNSTYSQGVIKYLDKISDEQKPKFIICNDTVAREKIPGGGDWLNVDHEYDTYLKKYNVPFVCLKNKNDSWDRWALYWEIYAKAHIEKVGDNLYTNYTENFNSGYGAMNMLLSYPIKELAVFGVNFYNFGVVRTAEDKYNQAYIDAQGKEGDYLGLDKLLHDQMSQIMHCKNVLSSDPRFILDEETKLGLYSESLAKRINKFKTLPKNLNTTR